MTSESIPARTRLGHILLNVADLDRAISFYRDVLGFDVVARLQSSAFVAAGSYYHHIGLATWESKGGSPPPPGSTGLNHFAINYPERRDLARALKRVLDHDWDIVDAADYGTHEAIYLHDPDSNKVELAWDREPSQWPQGEAIVTTRTSLDFASLLDELGEPYSAAHPVILSEAKNLCVRNQPGGGERDPSPSAQDDDGVAVFT